MSSEHDTPTDDTGADVSRTSSVEAEKGSSRAKSGSLLSAAGAVGFATLASRLLGLVREQVLAMLFGAGNATDAFNVAFRIPNLLRNLFAEGAMSASLIPTFTQALHEEGEERAWQLAGRVFRVLAVAVGFLALLGVIFARPLVEAFASAYHVVPGKFELTVRMTRIMFPYFPLVALAAAFMGVLNACGKFFFPALSSALFNLTSVGAGVLFAELIAHGHDFGTGLRPIEGMAIGVILGGVVQVLWQLPLLYRAGYRYPKRGRKRASEPASHSWYRDPALRRMLALMGPGIAGLAATQLSVLINTILATSQGAGAVSWLNYAFRLMQFPIGLFGVSLATAALPALSSMWVKGDFSRMEHTLEKALKHTFAINLPASAGLAFLGYPIVELIFQHGRFLPSDTRATALALAMYSIGLTAYSAVKVLVPTCYAMGNARLPVVISAITVAVALVLNILLVRVMGFGGLALGTSLGALTNAILLLWAVRAELKKVGGNLNISGLLKSFAQNLALALLMGVAVYFTWRILGQEMPGNGTGLRMLRVAILILEGIALTAGLGWIFGLSEFTELLESALRKVRSRLLDAQG